MRPPFSSWKVIARIAAVGGIALILMTGLVYSRFFGPAVPTASIEQFVVNPGETPEFIALRLRQDGFVKSQWAIRIALFEKTRGGAIRPGGFKISKSMDAWSIAQLLASPPPLAFVTFPPSIRKEQIGGILAATFFWNDAQKAEWIGKATNPDPNFLEGVYYPDTYLIPSDQSPSQIAARMRGRFTDVFAPYSAAMQKQGLSLNEVLTLASIVDREAGKNDKPLVAGILWNRIHKKMLLQADATLQYVRGTEGLWWPTPRSADKYIDSPFNTYKYVGLPPHPINNPSLDSIDAVLHPDKTNCLYYLHGNDHQIHCSVTYAGQKTNVKKYLQ